MGMLIGAVEQIAEGWELKWHKWRNHFGCRKCIYRYRTTLVLYMRSMPKDGWALHGPRAKAAAGIFHLGTVLVAFTGPGLVGDGGRAYDASGPWAWWLACGFTDGPGGWPVYSYGHPGPKMCYCCAEGQRTSGTEGHRGRAANRGTQEMRCTGWPPDKGIKRDARVPQLTGLYHLSSITRSSFSNMHIREGLSAWKLRNRNNGVVAWCLT